MVFRVRTEGVQAKRNATSVLCRTPEENLLDELHNCLTQMSSAWLADNASHSVNRSEVEGHVG